MAGVGILLALSGEDAQILRALNQPGSGMSVVRRCADLPELLSAGMAGLASIVVMDTGFEEIDRTVLERLDRAGLRGLLLVDSHDQERWRSTGWPVERRDADPARIRAVLQALIRQPPQATGPRSHAPEAPPAPGFGDPGRAGPIAGGPAEPWQAPAPGPQRGPAGPGAPEPAGASRAEQTAWLEELWQMPAAEPGMPGSGASPVGPDDPAAPAAPAMGPAHLEDRSAGPWPAPQAPGEPEGRLVVVWGTHGAPGRSTIAASLAHGLARVGGAILVDADIEAPCLVQLLGLPDDSSALAGAARLATHGRLDREGLAKLLIPVAQDVHLLAGLGRAGRWRELPPASMKELWLQCRRMTAWTVVDVAGGLIDDDVDDFTLEPGRGAVAAELLAHADVVVVVGGADPIGVRRLLQLVGDLHAEAVPPGRMEVVVNRVRASAAGPSPQEAVREAMGRFGGISDITLLPEDWSAADRCLLEGASVLGAAPTSALGRALAELVDRIDPSAAAVELTRRKRRRRQRRDAARDRRARGSQQGQPVQRRGRRATADPGRHGRRARHGADVPPPPPPPPG